MADLVWVMNDAKGPKSYLRLIFFLALIFPILTALGWFQNSLGGLLNLLISLTVSYIAGIVVFTIIIFLFKTIRYLISKL